MTEQPYLDHDHVDSLLEFLPPDKVRALFNSGLRGAPPLLAAMREAIAAGDGNALYRAGHTAKGMFGNLGMRRCEEISRVAEAFGKAEDPASAAPLIDDLQAALDQTNGVMFAWLDAKSPKD